MQIVFVVVLISIAFSQDVTSLVRQLHSRDSRRQFCAEGHWLSHKVAIDPAQVIQ